jgi:hypothetical protein
MPGVYFPAGGVSSAQAAIAALSALAGNAANGDTTIGVGTTTLSDVMHYNTLTVDGTLVARAWIIFARKVIVNATGIIHWDGADAAAAVAGAAYTGGYLSGNCAGVAGATGAGAAPGATNNAIVMLPRSGALGTTFKGGAGGAGTPNAGGNAGTTTAGGAGRQARHHPMSAFFGAQSATAFLGTPFGGSGGGAGGGDGVNSGGGGGAGGGFGLIIAGEVVNNGIIRSRGGNGGNAAAGNCGGGGGGGGGMIMITCGLYSGNLPLVTGGTPGNGIGTGVVGNSGNDGDYFINQYK